ncbi:MAG: PAS domain S-box protein [Fimbriimonadaceae bacterium]
MWDADEGLRLSKREAEVVAKASDGLTDKEIARALGISVATVGSLWGRIRAKLGPRNRAELVARYVKHQMAKAIEAERPGGRGVGVGETLGLAAMANAEDGILILNENMRILYANPAVGRMTGYTSPELLGQPISILVPERFRQMHETRIAAWVRHPVSRRMGDVGPIPMRRRDGSEIDTVIGLGAWHTPSGLSTICLIQEVHPHDRRNGTQPS